MFGTFVIVRIVYKSFIELIINIVFGTPIMIYDIVFIKIIRRNDYDHFQYN